MRIAAVLLVTSLLTGCATSHVMIGQARPPISADQVKIYYRPPARYEEIALLDTSSKGGFGITSQGKTDVVIRRLKGEAAKLGANGVLLNGIGNVSTGSVGTGFGSATANGETAYGTGIGISGSLSHKVGSGVAIFVSQE